MPKFFIPREQINENELYIQGEDVAHITRVLRMGKGDTLTACDRRGYDYEAEIEAVMDKEIKCVILDRQKCGAEANIEVTLFQGLPKASKMDYIIQKTTELGINTIVPCKLARCVVKLEGVKAEQKKVMRWQKISEEAAKQSGRGIIPKVEMPVTIDEAIDKLKEYDIVFVPYECEEENHIKDVLLSVPNPKRAAFMIGPEGGFDIGEIEKIKAAGIKTVTLGKRILRTETAGEAVLAMIMYEIGDINK